MKKFLGIWAALILTVSICAANINGKDKEFIIYPNPVTDNTIHFNSSEEIQYVEVVNILGSVVYKETFSEPVNSLEIRFENNLDKGVYLLKAETRGQTTFIQKFMAK